jgi:murein DD-endopeptidase MepM/ murein hydrolase activator NlpD
MPAGLVNAVKIVAAAMTIALSLWLVGVQRDPVSGPVSGPVSAPVSGPAPAVVTSQPAPVAARPAAATQLASECEAVGNMIIPVRGIRPEQLADTFNDARSEGRRHDAIDIMAPLGVPVIAAAPGKVEKLFLSDAGGITAYVRSPNGSVIYYYAHLDRYAPGLTEGAQLASGAPIGAVGFTGNANPAAPHLHFAIMTTTPDKKWWEAKDALNPYPLLAGRGDQFLGGCRR